MRVNVYLFSSLRKEPFHEITGVTLHNGATVRDLLQKLMIDVLDVGNLSINKKTATFDQALSDTDNITIIPHIGGG